jgi:uncharacterized protein YdhG (YjbR/CyaY superfamily)
MAKIIQKTVDELLDATKHPLMKEIQAVRKIIKDVNPDITEEWKWNAPSFSYKDNYLVTFNLRMNDKVHLVFHNPNIVKIKSDLLEGDYKDRRMMYFKDLKDIKSKENELISIISELLSLII